MPANEGDITRDISIKQAGFVLFTLYWASWIIYCRLFHPLRDIPGPFLASISRLWIVWKTTNGDIELTERDLHARHGMQAWVLHDFNRRQSTQSRVGYMVRVAPNEFTCSDPEAIKVNLNT